MITPERLQQIGTTEAVRELSRTSPEVNRALRLENHGTSYEQCLEMAVIALANNAKHYQDECVRLMMNAPAQPVNVRSEHND